MKWKKTSYRFFWKVFGSNWVNGAPLTRLILYEATYKCFGTTLNFQFFSRFFSHNSHRNKSYIVIFLFPVSNFFCNKARCTLAHMYIKAAPLWHTLQTKLSPEHLHFAIEHLQILCFHVHRVQKLHNVPICSHQFFYYFAKKNVIKSKKMLQNPT